MIDDGSTDGSGTICDEYADKDERVRVFHTENRGLSAARNLGLDEATGEYIGFVDSDDWVEPDMYEVLLKRAEETGADVVECGVYREYLDRCEEQKREDKVISGTDVVESVIFGKISIGVMNKIWKSNCFECIRFPEGRVYEDVATTYRVLAAVNCFRSLDICKYHYVFREGSITNSYTIRNLVDLWQAQIERYHYCISMRLYKCIPTILRLCAKAVIKIWVNYCAFSSKECESNQEVIKEMNHFVKQHYPLFGYREWPLVLRIGIAFPHFINIFSFRMANLAYEAYKKIYCKD